MSREAFEKWANLSELVSFANNFDRRGEGYHDPMINLAWWAWQAALSQQAGEPVGYVLQSFLDESKTDSGRCSTITAKPWRVNDHNGQVPVYTRPQPAVPEGEAVAWLIEGKALIGRFQKTVFNPDVAKEYAELGNTVIPLCKCTHQPAAQVPEPQR